MNKRALAATAILLIAMSTSIIFNTTTFAVATKPIDLRIYVSPSSILADNSSYTCIFVQLINAEGNPARAEQETTIYLSSSTPGIGIVDETTTIYKNETYASANFTSTYLPGTTTITATAPNYATVASTLTTIGPYPYKTTVYGFPSILPADGTTYDAVMVQLQDLNGLPARAPNDVQVSLFSSNNATGSVNSSITILQGQTFAVANFTTTGVPGKTNITAAGHGYASTQQTFETAVVTSPDSLHIFEGPPQVLADNNVYRQIAVELQDSSGKPSTLPSDTMITIASSDNTIATTDNEITIPAGSSYAVANLYTTYRAGVVIITAATNGLITHCQALTTVGYTPSKLAVFCAPSNLPADNSTYPAVQVQLQDNQGRPARNPDSGAVLKLFSSNLAVGDVVSPITILLGKTQATGNFSLSTAPGITTITAMASNYTTGQANMTTIFIDYRPTEAAVTVKPDSVSGGNSVQVSAYITGDGSPLTGAKVTFTSDIGGTFSAVQEDNGYYNTTFTAPNLSVEATCTITVNASKTMWLDCAGTSEVTVLPAIAPTSTPTPTATPTPTSTPTETPAPTATPSPTPTPSASPDSTATGIAPLKLWVKDSDGRSLSGITITSTAQPAGSPVLTGVTDALGYVIFENVTAGSYTFQVNTEGYEQVNQTFDATSKQLTHTIMLSNAASTTNSQSDVTSPFILPAVLAVIIGITVVVVIVFVRRRWDIKLSRSPE